MKKLFKKIIDFFVKKKTNDDFKPFLVGDQYRYLTLEKIALEVKCPVMPIKISVGKFSNNDSYDRDFEIEVDSKDQLLNILKLLKPNAKVCMEPMQVCDRQYYPFVYVHIDSILSDVQVLLKMYKSNEEVLGQVLDEFLDNKNNS